MSAREASSEQHEVSRPFGLWTATALVVGGMIGSGIFLLPAQIAPYGWTGIVAWPIAVTGAMVMAYVLTRLTAALPEESGGIAIIGRVLGPVAGVLVGWSYWVSVCAANASIALAAISYLARFFPVLAATQIAGALASVALIWALTLLNLAGARAAGRFQVITTLLKLLPLLAVAVIVAVVGLTAPSAFTTEPHPSFSAGLLTAAATLVFFPLVGFEAANVVAERVHRPEVNVVRATLAGTAVTGLLYVIVSSGIVLLLPSVTVMASSAPIATFVGRYWGTGAELVIAAFAVISTVGALNGWVLIQGEVPLGMARAGLLPRWLAVTGAHDVPVRVLIVSSVLASILILTSASGSLVALFNFVILLSTASNIWFYLAACAAALHLGIARGWAVAGAIFGIWFMAGTGLTVFCLSVLLMLSALPLYWLRNRGRTEQAT